MLIYNQIAKNTALGSAPSEWLVKAKQTYYKQEGQQFAFERAWSLLKLVIKWQNMAKKGKARNGQNSTGTALQPITEDNVSSPAPNATSHPNSNAKGQEDSAAWKHLAGIKAEKRKIEEGNFCCKKFKLLEKQHQDLVKRIAKASWANNIQEKQALIDQVESNHLIMLQDLNQCPNEES